MIWSVDPPPPIRATAPPPNGSAGGTQQNSHPKSSMSIMSSPPRVSMMGKPEGQQGQSMSIGPGSMALNANANGEKGMGGASSAVPGISLTRPGSVQVPPPSSAPEQQSPGGGIIPRANFFSKVPGVRPRSRNFSVFNMTKSEVPLPNNNRGPKSIINID